MTCACYHSSRMIFNTLLSLWNYAVIFSYQATNENHLQPNHRWKLGGVGLPAKSIQGLFESEQRNAPCTIMKNNAKTQHSSFFVLNSPSQYLQSFSVDIIIYRSTSLHEINKNQSYSVPKYSCNKFFVKMFEKIWQVFTVTRSDTTHWIVFLVWQNYHNVPTFTITLLWCYGWQMTPMFHFLVKMFSRKFSSSSSNWVR